MKLTPKIILIIVLTVTTIISVIFYVMALRFETQMERQLLMTARSVYKNILTMRRWVAEYNGVYVEKPPGVKSNPYLPFPERITVEGDTLTKKNPALVTREMSELGSEMGTDFGFHMSSRNFINPANKPNSFEESALIFFKDSLNAKSRREFYRIETKGSRTFFRYFAPLFTKESCLSCHSRQGYKVGDLRGGISVLLPMDNYQKAQKDNLLFFLKAAIFSIVFLSILIFIALRRIVIKPLRYIETGAREIRDGNYNFELTLPQKDEIGNLANAFEVMRERVKSYTEKLRASEKKYRSLIEHSIEAVAIMNPESLIIECNNKFKNLTGYGVDELKSMSMNQLIDTRARKDIDTPFNPENDAEHFETTLYSKDNLEIPIELYIIHGFTLNSISKLSFVYVRDLSERKKIEQYSVQTEKMFALGQMSSGIAHEIRNPLFALSNNIDYLNRKFNDSREFQEIYPELQDGIDRIHRIVSAILDFARPHKPEFKSVRIDEVIKNSLALVKKQFEKSAISIHTDFPEAHKKIAIDPHQFEQVLINLFLNSYHAMEGRGQLTIRTKCRKHILEIEITDTGKGIPAEEIDRIFDPFYSKTPNGTGLGLAIVHRILDQHNAKYRVESRQNFGTTFTIFLPYKQE